MKTIQEASIQELEKAIKEKKKAAYQKLLDERSSKAQEWNKLIPTLLILFSEHRKGCSDKSPSRSCERCVLLNFQDSQWWNNDYELTISLNYNPVRNPYEEDFR